MVEAWKSVPIAFAVLGSLQGGKLGYCDEEVCEHGFLILRLV